MALVFKDTNETKAFFEYLKSSKIRWCDKLSEIHLSTFKVTNSQSFTIPYPSNIPQLGYNSISSSPTLEFEILQ